ncbi:dna repair rad51 protein [Rutstroemia sp. NJR-2017a WRK4]|nr:dna repair rad51 protein [Rutstroemia sp. NJR-2017a WRK4]PQE14862.1 dna repair rad51 protein [Rutstroemia sp. NJR-2017a WRK4]
MADKGPFHSYKETKLTLDPSTQNSIIAIRLPVHGAPAPRTSQKRSHVAELAIAEDERAFKQKHLATAASIYHRTQDVFPQSYLWRILEDGKVLSIQAVDVSKQLSVADAHLTLRLSFPSSIKQGCVAFSDCKEHDYISAFVLTETHHLYTLRLWPDFFRNASSTENNVGNWCKSYISSAFSFKKPHRMVALSANELLVSNFDGGLLKLDRKSGGDGSEWKESHYNPGGWRDGLKSFIPFQGSNTIRHGDANVELSTVTSIASPATCIDGFPYAFTVSLDHNLRIWNLSSGRISYVGDILGAESDAKNTRKPVIDPSYQQLVKVYCHNDENAICVTYSPIGEGQFKFWNITPAGNGSISVADAFPNNTLVPRPPTSDLWTLADFSVVVDRGNNALNLWTLWKNNTTYRVQKLYFESGSDDDVQELWEDGWEATATETLSQTPLPTIYHGDASDSTDKWLGFILYPGRFTQATIETGLAIYERGLGSSRDTVRKTAPLPERLCSTIAITATLGRTSDGSPDFEQFRLATDAQWRRFYRLLVELDKQRGEALSLVIDPKGNMPWVISADGISAIRDCSNFERIWHNPEEPPRASEYVSTLASAAAAFRETVSDQLFHSFNAALLGQLFEEPSGLPSARMKALYDICDYTNQITDEDYHALVASLGGDFKDITPQVYEDLLSSMVTAARVEKDPIPLASSGNKLIVRGAQEAIELHRGICIDQLLLLVLIEVEINHGEEGIDFDSAPVFDMLLTMLKRLELIAWLAKTQMDLPLPNRERSNSLNESTSSITKKQIQYETVTVLEGVHRHLFGFERRVSMSSALTDFIVELCKPDSSYESPPAIIQCFLLKQNRHDLAMEFSRFAGHDAFATYIQGRACLAANDPRAASLHFKKAAFGMAYPDQRKHTNQHSAGYLDETEKQLLNAGLPEYYSHIVSLYDKEKIHSYVIDFSRLALQFIKPSSPSSSSLSSTDALRTEMHSRLFFAALHTSRFDLAHSTLSLISDSALQTSSLRSLITKMCEANHASQLVALPFIGLQDQVDDVLAQKCRAVVEVATGIPWHKVLYAWRIQHGDFRGAAAVGWERLGKLRGSADGERLLTDAGAGEGGIAETQITKQFVAVINALSCVDPKQAWILCEGVEGRERGKDKGRRENADAPGEVKRTVVTLEAIRRGYQEELDRVAAIEMGQFALMSGGAEGDAMDIL